MKRRVAIWALLPAVFFLSLGCGPGEDNSEVQGEQAKVVRVMEAEQVSLQRKRRLAGTARAAETVPLSFEIDGRISSLSVEMGQRVEAGAVVARLDCSDYRLEAQRRKSDVDRAEAVLDRARSDYHRVRNLYEKEHTSRSKLDRASAEYRSAKAGLRGAEKALELARNRVKDCILTTDRAGYISRVPAEEQQNVRAGQTVAVLSLTDRMQLRVFVPQELVTRLQPGDRAEVYFRSLSEEMFPAQVGEVGVEAARSTTYPVRLDIEREPEELRPGMVGRAVFRFPQSPGIVLPAKAVLGREGEKAWIFVVDPKTHRAQKRFVEVGSLTEKGLLLRGGLQEGELVVIRGMTRLEQGQEVEMKRD